MSQHTPGPWEATFTDYRGAFDPLVMGSDVHEICFVYKHRQDQSVTIANANLIAAAPEMLEVLRWLDNEMDCRDSGFGGCLFSRGDFARVRAVIKSATEIKGEE